MAEKTLKVSTIRNIIHAAVMQHNGVSRIISTDKHFDQIDGVSRLDPQKLYQSAKG